MIRPRVLCVLLAGALIACEENTTEPQPAPVATVEITPASATVTEGDTVRLSARVADRDGNDLTGRAVTWSSLGPGTATVAGGLVTGVAAGSTLVTASSEGVSDTAAITVEALVPAVPSLALVAEGFSLPTFLTSPPGDATRLFVTELPGLIHIIDEGTRNPTPFLDMSSETGCCERSKGLLAMAFHPDYGSNGLFYLFFNDNNGDSRLTEYQVSSNPDLADAGSARDLLVVAQQEVAHVGGQIAFGPDGFLYVSFGDGTSAGEADAPRNGQNLENFYSTILRLDVNSGSPYGIPPDNPFVGQGSALPEIWAYGLRNPWRFSFDRLTGDLYIGDVGAKSWEEIDVQPASSSGGQNYGWSEAEGTDCFRAGCELSSFTPPFHQYAHTAAPSCSGSVTGGYVYRGTALQGFQGVYFFGDFCDSVIRSFRPAGGAATELETWTALSSGLAGLVTFGEDAEGELYVVSINDGRVYAIVPAE